MQFYETNICRIKIFSLHTFYKNHDDDKNGDQTREKLQILSQVPTHFAEDYNSRGII